MFISKPNDDGIVFVTGEPHKYLVTYEIKGEMCEPAIKTASEVFHDMEFDDCFDIKIVDIRLLRLSEDDPYPECKYHGTWCNYDPETGKIDSLRVEIRTKNGNEVLDVGYQPEH